MDLQRQYSTPHKNWWERDIYENRAITKGMSVKEKLDFYSIPEPNTGCWIWIGSLGANGYGNMILGGKTLPAHRISYEQYIGLIPKGMCVCHKCDVRSCINPDHLFIGTHKDNMSDAVQKGRIPKGEAQARSKLTEAQVIDIFNDERPRAEISRDYNISKPTISAIKIGRNWKYLNLTERSI